MIDGCYRAFYQCAYQMMRVYWRLTHPTTHGALVAVWHQGRVLLIQNSYVRYYSLPGGYVRNGESSRAAAARELAEEVSIHVSPDELTATLDVTHDWEGKRDHVELFALTVAQEPRVAVDNREVVSARLLSPAEALELELFPPLRQYLREHARP